LEINQNVEEMPKSFKLMVPSRVFLYEGSLKKISGKHDQERQFFLFNDCLMYCKIKGGGGRFTCKGIIYLNKLTVIDIPGDALSFKIKRSDKNLEYTLHGQSSQEKSTWLHELKIQQQKLNLLSVRGTQTLPVGGATVKKEVIRLYISKDTFKSLAVTEMSTVSDLCEDALVKTKLEGSLTADDLQIYVVVNGKERVLTEDEKPYEVRAALVKQGIKFGNETNHFKLAKKPTSQTGTAAAASSSPVGFSSDDDGSSSDRTSASPPAVTSSSLGDDWQEYQDEQGNVYFHNANTGESRWPS